MCLLTSATSIVYWSCTSSGSPLLCGTFWRLLLGRSTPLSLKSAELFLNPATSTRGSSLTTYSGILNFNYTLQILCTFVIQTSLLLSVDWSELNPSSKRFGTFLARSHFRLGSSVPVVTKSLRLLLVVGGVSLLILIIFGADPGSDVAGGHWVVGSLISQTIPNAAPTLLASHVVVSGTEIFFVEHLIFRIFSKYFLVALYATGHVGFHPTWSHPIRKTLSFLKFSNSTGVCVIPARLTNCSVTGAKTGAAITSFVGSTYRNKLNIGYIIVYSKLCFLVPFLSRHGLQDLPDCLQFLLLLKIKAAKLFLRYQHYCCHRYPPPIIDMLNNDGKS